MKKLQEQKNEEQNMLILGIIAVILAASALIIVIVNIFHDTSMDSEFTLYIGTNDKDMNELVLSMDEVISRIDKICCSYIKGYTLFPANGRWIKDNNILSKENIIILKIYGSDKETIRKIADELLIALNQKSILIVNQKTHYDFYSC